MSVPLETSSSEKQKAIVLRLEHMPRPWLELTAALFPELGRASDKLESISALFVDTRAHVRLLRVALDPYASV